MEGLNRPLSPPWVHRILGGAHFLVAFLDMLG